LGFFKARLLIVTALALAVSGCGGSRPKPPTGQVVANAAGREITVRQLHAELGNAAAGSPAEQKEQQRSALRFMIERTVLAEEARKEGIDKDPEFNLLNQRATDMLLVQQLQAKIAAAVPPPSKEEAVQFQNANPNLFAERKIFDVDQIRIDQPADRSVLTKLQPLKTLDEVANFLNQNHLPYLRGTSTIDAVGQDPKLVNAIVALPPQEVFVFSAGSQILINQVRNTRVDPLTGAAADKYALNILRLQHTQAAVQKQLTSVILKSRSTTQIAKEYLSPKPAPAAPAKAPVKTGG
jgi:peptidyl-prolyl cis-trans isomerase C